MRERRSALFAVAETIRPFFNGLPGLGWRRILVSGRLTNPIPAQPQPLPTPCPSLSSRMEALVYLPQALPRDVGVDLGGGDVGVAEHELDGAQVGAAFDQVGGEGVA